MFLKKFLKFFLFVFINVSAWLCWKPIALHVVYIKCFFYFRTSGTSNGLVFNGLSMKFLGEVSFFCHGFPVIRVWCVPGV